ncbi:MAG: FkbM family methyltransferase [Alphaproteobacteria bacterium]|nr:FkbM family methyltransferase [Alphaproteobacteria bacterium]
MNICRIFKKKTKKIDKYAGYNPASTGREMQQFVDWIKNWSRLEVHNIMEIGANFAQDSEYLAKAFNISDDNVWVFEAHPQIYDAITKIHKFNAFNYAVFNEEKQIEFNAVDINSAKNTGVSSLLDDKSSNEATTKVSVKAIRMDKFLAEHNIKEVDLLKLDVEGCNFEVLEGFGERLNDVKSIHIEAEHVNSSYENNVLFPKMEGLLKSFGFEMIYFQRFTSQSDSFWVKKQYIKNHRLEK